MTSSASNRLPGFFLASLAGICWGSMGVAAQYLMQTSGFRVTDLVSLRLFSAGVILVMLAALRRPALLLSFLSKRRNVVDATIYGLGLLVIQWTFFQSIAVSNAATAALMVTTAPLFVTSWTAFSEHRPMTRREVLCLLSAFAGVSLLVTKGDFSTLDFSAAGVCWGIASSAAGAFCTIQPRRILAVAPVDFVAGIGLTIGGGVLLLASPPALAALPWSLETAAMFAFISLVGTVGAFCCYLKSLEYVPAPVTALLVNFEPLTAVLLGVFLLGLELSGAELLGIGFIALMVAMLAKR